MTNESVEKRLQRCTVRLSVAAGQGTGFFVASRLLLTCAHVVKGAGSQLVDVYWQEQDRHYKAEIAKLIEEAHLDLALLRLDTEIPNHPCVHLDQSVPDLGAPLYSYGYPKSCPDGDSVTLEYEGESFKGNSPLYKLKAGLVDFGFSGSALLNQRSGKVCGIVNLSRNPSIDIGGRAVPVKVIFAQFPELAELNREFHQQNQQPTRANPFEYGPPVPPDRFYGRHRAIADVKNRIGAISAQCINIVGMRRNGKSSLLRYIRERTEVFCPIEQKPLIVTLDLQDKKFHTPEGILEGLRRGITKLTGTEPWLRNANDDPFEVEDGLQALCDRGYRLIVMLDEFERIGERLEEFQGWGEDWRAKASAGLLALVIASIRPLGEIYESLSLTSPFSNIFSTTILGALEEEAWQQLVTDGFSQGGKGEALPEILQWIDDLAGGLPFYTQMAASLLWQYGDRTQAKSEFIFQASDHFRNLWHNLKPPERQILKNIVNDVSGSLQSTAVVDTLKRHGVLAFDGRLFSSAFIDFVQSQR
jgi:hypothetical protein